VERWNSSGSDDIYVYGPSGKLLTVVQVNTLGSSPWMTLSTLSNRVYFGGMLLGTTTGYAVSDADLIKDRLGSVQPSYAYGTDTGSGQQTSPGDDFATYWKDSSTGFEYAMNRYYSAGYGRFLTVDQFGGSARVRSPLSLNRYLYSGGDPVNRRDASGLDDFNDFGGICLGANMSYACGIDGNNVATDGLGGTTGGSGDETGGGAGCSVGAGFDESSPGPFSTPGCDSTGSGSGDSQPQCSISLQDRPVAHTGGAFIHTYLDVSEVSATGVLEINDVLEGGAQYPHNFLKYPFAPWGNLVGHAEPVPPPGTPIAPNTYFLGATNPYSDPTIGSEVGGADVCGEVQRLMDAIVDYSNTAGVPYSLWPRGSSRNSNSFTYTLLYDIGLTALFGQSVSSAPGWGMLVPGLN